MPGSSIYLATTAAPVHPETITGRELDRRLRHANAAQRVLLAHDLVVGRIRLERLTELQSRCLTGVGYFLRTMGRPSDGERAEIQAGRLDLSDLHHRGGHHPPSDADVARIARLAPERVLKAIGRAPRPVGNGQGRSPPYVAAAE